MTTSLLFDRISAVSPASLALRNGSQRLSYGELDRQSAVLARKLTSLAAGAASPVAICLNRSFEQIVAALAAMRAGSAYVPIDPAWPDERIQYVVADSGAAVFVAPAALSRRISSSATPLDPRTLAAATPSASDIAQALPTPSENDLAYIIYTSGSTGVPKGVEITHRNLNHLVTWHVDAFAVTAEDRASHLAGLGFDAAVWEVWPYLSVGASIDLADDITRTDSVLLQRWIVDREITIAFVPTPVAHPLLAMDWPAATRLRTLLTGGDRLHASPKKGLPFTVVNNYGPTECTVVATSGRVEPESSGLPSIGRPILGTAIYLLNDQKQPVPLGERGEVYIGGNSVGRGYRNLPDLTAQAFLSDPFASDPHARMYKTGDIASLLPDGQIGFHGRADNQEKIRGNRVELDEIVSVLNRHPEVGSSVVVTSTDATQEKHLIAYVQPVEGASLTLSQLREFAQKSLPSYMIPSVYVQISSLPITTNGKIDRNALPHPSKENFFPDDVSRDAGTEVEGILLKLVRSVLGTDRIGVDDDFFLVGGHSLLGTQLVMRARETFGVMVTLRDLFEASTVARLAARIEALIVKEIDAMTEEEALRLATEDRI